VGRGGRLVRGERVGNCSGGIGVSGVGVVGLSRSLLLWVSGPC